MITWLFSPLISEVVIVGGDKRTSVTLCMVSTCNTPIHSTTASLADPLCGFNTLMGHYPGRVKSCYNFNFSQSSLKHNIQIMWEQDMMCLMWAPNLVNFLNKPLLCCMQYHVTLGYDIMGIHSITDKRKFWKILMCSFGSKYSIFNKIHTSGCLLMKC